MVTCTGLTTTGKVEGLSEYSALNPLDIRDSML